MNHLDICKNCKRCFWFGDKLNNHVWKNNGCYQLCNNAVYKSEKFNKDLMMPIFLEMSEDNEKIYFDILDNDEVKFQFLNDKCWMFMQHQIIDLNSEEEL